MSEAPSTAPVCYRHPSRETSVRCTRCDRPICTDCMHVASVGHQCPECVSEGRRTVRQARTAFGGTLVGRAGYATRALIGINVLFLVISVITGGSRAIAGGGGFGGLMGSSTPLTQWGSVLGYASYVPGGPAHGVAAGEWYRLVTAMFLHYGALHLLLNMILLWQLGRYLEDKLGPLRFLAIYLLAGLGGNVAAYVFSPQNQSTAGASTAVFGLILAVFVVNRKLRLDTSTLIPLIVVNLLFTFTVRGISIPGHIGGLLVGGIVAALMAYAPRQNRNVIQWGGAAAVLVVLVIIAIVRTQQLLS
ncbi:rhomboid family intramembrane serine protease [Actinoplanes sp. TBRC 11911]|uniref:rhomboid family intramembrane serine protease n=1 Tax=Actinoplanes sp. TBRC 11911 TaxID=2729386 RepID=UPI00145C7645|nr:rhomboid family intramembrane serine protease [Actinoplanes sp. TBRC 11911]NMO54505.1 rhomboid family intramembrane serine protease [Actinoplanes sp. TBRC 11911]